MADWQPIETAPFQTVIEVRNFAMEKPCLATRGYTHDGMVHPDTTFCTSVFTPGEVLPRAYDGNLVCPTEWRLPEPPATDGSDKGMDRG